MNQEAERRGRREAQNAEPAPIRVAVADKNPLVLAGLKHLLIEDERFELAVTASDGEHFLEAILERRTGCARMGRSARSALA